MLEAEIQFFNESRDEWVKQFPGKITLVKGRKLIGVFDSDNDAIVEGVRRYGLESFLVRRVEREQPLPILLPHRIKHIDHVAFRQRHHRMNSV